MTLCYLCIERKTGALVDTMHSQQAKQAFPRYRGKPAELRALHGVCDRCSQERDGYTDGK